MRRIFLSLLLVALSPVAYSEGVQEAEIDVPLSGWHPAEGEDANFSQSINYPTSPINMADDQNISVQVRSKIRNYAMTGRVQQSRLVANGVSMPQRIESNGSLARPYIFTEGSNSVQVISPDRQSRQETQFYSAPGTGTIRACLRPVFSRDTDNTDPDLYVIIPDGEHTWYGNTVLKNNGALDMDVTMGHGSEIFAVPALVHGRYQVYINYCSGRSEMELTIAQLALITDEGSVNKKRETFIVPICNAGELMLVKSFNW